MTSKEEQSKEIFSFHLAKLPVWRLPQYLLRSLYKQNVSGLIHSESFITMNLGEPVVAASRYNFNTVALFAWWSEEHFLTEFLNQPPQKLFEEGWHVRMRPYRRWGQVSELKDVFIDPKLAAPGKPVVAVTLARLLIQESARFAKWGKPVERQVYNHKGKQLALAAIRPLNTFCTFSIWQNEAEMLNMVSGRESRIDGEDHKLAMQERVRRDFHSEFTTMRFSPFKEVGSWSGRSNYTSTVLP